MAVPETTGAAPGAGRVAVIVAAGAALLIWGGTPIVTKIAVARVDPVMVGILRTILPAAVATPFLLALRARLTLPRGRGHRPESPCRPPRSGSPGLESHGPRRARWHPCRGGSG